MSYYERLEKELAKEYLENYQKKLEGDGLNDLMKSLNLPRDIKPGHQKYEAMQTLINISGSIDVLNNWRKQRKPTPIPRDDLEKLTKAFSDMTGKTIDPKKISSEYMTVDDLIADNLDSDDVAEFCLWTMKCDEIKKAFYKTSFDQSCKWILYFDVLAEIDMQLLIFICTISTMSERGKEEVKKLFSKQIGFENFIASTEISHKFIELKEKIKNKQAEKEAREYIIKIMEEIARGNKYTSEEMVPIVFETLWKEFTSKIDSYFDGYGPWEEYLLFSLKMGLFLNLFKEKNVYIWDWIINYSRIEDKDKFLRKIDKLYSENADYRITNEEILADQNDALKD